MKEPKKESFIQLELYQPCSWRAFLSMFVKKPSLKFSKTFVGPDSSQGPAKIRKTFFFVLSCPLRWKYKERDKTKQHHHYYFTLIFGESATDFTIQEKKINKYIDFETSVKRDINFTCIHNLYSFLKYRKTQSCVLFFLKTFSFITYMIYSFPYWNIFRSLHLDL